MEIRPQETEAYAAPGYPAGARGRHRKAIPPLATGLSAAALLLLSLACGDKDYKAVSLEPIPPAAQGETSAFRRLRVGLAPILSVQSGGEGLAALCDALSRRLGRAVEPMIGSDYREINDLLDFGQLEAGIVCAGAFADPRLTETCEPLLVPLLVGAGATYQSFLVVRRDDPARRLEDLRDGSIVFTDSLSLTGFIHPVIRLSALGSSPRAFFSKISFSHSHDRSLAMVAGGAVRAAAVDSSVYTIWHGAGSQDKEGVRILEASEHYPAPPIVVRKSLPAADRQALRAALLDLAGTEEGKAILRKIGWTGFQVPDAPYLERLERLRRTYRKLRAQNLLPS